jgi:hypothetical protein
VYGVFWWASAMARLDTRDTQAMMRERYPAHGKTYIREMFPPEEVTTFTLARRLCFKQQQRGGEVAAALHSRALEGGHKGRRSPSGADLELAVQVEGGGWVDLLLQAKRIYRHRNDGRGYYKEWKRKQVDNLRQWAWDHGGRTPGILLYNAEIPPFGGLQEEVKLGGCCSSPIRCYGSKWPPRSMRYSGSPLAITLVVLPPVDKELPQELQGDAIAAHIVNKFASPLECISCSCRHLSRNAKFHGPDPGISGISVKDYTPEWADEFLNEWRQGVNDEEGDIQGDIALNVDEEPMRNANYSLVFPLAPRDE